MFRPCHISRQLRVSHGCVSKILYRFDQTGTVAPGQIGGASKQSRKLVENMEQKALEIHQKNPDIPAAQIRGLLMAGGSCDRATAPSTHSIAKLIRNQQKSMKKSLKHSISGILGENKGSFLVPLNISINSRNFHVKTCIQ
jgi:paired box protein 3/7